MLQELIDDLLSTNKAREGKVSHRTRRLDTTALKVNKRKVTRVGSPNSKEPN